MPGPARKWTASTTWKGTKIGTTYPKNGGMAVAPAPVKVKASDRPVYDQCAAAMMAGHLCQWSIDEQGAWQVQATEGGEWVEYAKADLVALLAELGHEVPTVAGRARRESSAIAAVPDVVDVDEVHELEPEDAPVVDSPILVADALAPAPEGRTSKQGPAGDKVAEYLARLVHEPKRAYATAYAAFLAGDGPYVQDPEGNPEWAQKARAKLDRMVPTTARLEAVAS